MKARVLVRPKSGILDPQGQAVQRALPALGFTDVHEVRVGRLIELELDDPNPQIEDYDVVYERAGANGAGA